MPHPYSWPLATPPGPTSPGGGSSSTSSTPVDLLVSRNRFGLVRPFVRDQVNDFAAANGKALIESELGQILGTECNSEKGEGELPWRPEFGSLIFKLRHRNGTDIVTQELARAWAIDAIARWHPTVRPLDAAVSMEKDAEGNLSRLLIRIRYEVRARGSGQILGTGTALVPLALAA